MTLDLRTTLLPLAMATAVLQVQLAFTVLIAFGFWQLSARVLNA